jgi:hypothetical protein
MTFSEGNLKYTVATNQRGCMSNWEVPLEGKWYWEFTQVSWGNTDGDDAFCGINLATVDFTASRGGKATGYNYAFNNGHKVIQGTDTTYGDSIRTGDVVGVAVDRVNDTIEFYKNGVGQGTFGISATLQLFPWFGSGGGGSSAVGIVNFGADSSFAGQSGLVGDSANAADTTGYGDFYDTPPTDFLALCTGNLATPAADPAEEEGPTTYFAPKIYTGTGSSNALTGLGFQPDWVWIKERGGANDHKLTDSSRGVTKSLESNESVVEATDSDGLTAFGSDGFTVGSDGVYNNSGDTYVSWNWKVNGGTTSANTIGDIDSVVQIDADRGISIVQYTGIESATTIGHGLSAIPQFIMVRCRDFSRDWACQLVPAAVPGTSFILNTTASDSNGGGYWNTTAPTATIFSVGGGSETGKSGKLFVAYCFASKEGFSQFGKYEGNGDTDGIFVNTGFRPAWIMFKRFDSTGSWHIYDDKRNTGNPTDSYLLADTSGADDTADSNAVDFLSNGFKLRNVAAGLNADGGDYFYASFAKNPIKYSTAR